MNHMKKTDCILYVQKFNMDQTHLEDILEYLILKSILNNWIFMKRNLDFKLNFNWQNLWWDTFWKLDLWTKSGRFPARFRRFCVTPSGNTLCPEGQKWFIHCAVIFFERRLTFDSEIRRLEKIFVVRTSTFHQEK